MTDQWDTMRQILLEHKRLDAQRKLSQKWGKMRLIQSTPFWLSEDWMLNKTFTKMWRNKIATAFAFEMSDKSTCTEKGWHEKDYLEMLLLFFISSR